MVRRYRKENFRSSDRRNGTLSGRLLDFAAGFDWLQILSLAVLLGIGLVFIRSTGLQVGTAKSITFFPKQLLWIAVGSVLWLAASLIDFRSLSVRVLTLFFYVAMIALLVAVLVVGARLNGASSWINIPGINFRLQPSEFGKLSTILLLSALFSSPLFNVNGFFSLLTAGAVTLLPMVLIAWEPDFGSAAVLFPVFCAITFAAGIKWRYLAVAAAAVLLLLGALTANELYGPHKLLKEYQVKRIKVFLHPELDLFKSGYNQYQARLAVGSGGVYGKGVGSGSQNSLGFLPQPVSNNDFIFSVIAEESGFVGSLLLLATYALFFLSVFRTAWESRDPFGRYVAVGFGAMLFAHCFINVGMCIGLAPVTGIPLPFVSYGGSFILMGLTGAGILQSFHRHREKQ